MVGVPVDWTPARLDLLRTLIADHRSSGQIAERMGVSRNAVCAKAARLGLKFTCGNAGLLTPEQRRLLQEKREAAARRRAEIAETTEARTRERERKQAERDRTRLDRERRIAVQDQARREREQAQAKARLEAQARTKAGPAAPTKVQEIRLGGVVLPHGEWPKRSQCRWLFNDARDAEWRWCGAPKVPGRSPYCAEHLAKSFRGAAAAKAFYARIEAAERPGMAT